MALILPVLFYSVVHCVREQQHSTYSYGDQVVFSNLFSSDTKPSCRFYCNNIARSFLFVLGHSGEFVRQGCGTFSGRLGMISFLLQSYCQLCWVLTVPSFLCVYFSSQKTPQRSNTAEYWTPGNSVHSGQLSAPSLLSGHCHDKDFFKLNFKCCYFLLSYI